MPAPGVGFSSAIPSHASRSGSAGLLSRLILALPAHRRQAGPRRALIPWPPVRARSGRGQGAVRARSGRGRAAFEPRAFGDGKTRVADKRAVPFGACAPEVDGAPPRLVELRVAAVSAEPRSHAESKAHLVRRLISHVMKDKRDGQLPSSVADGRLGGRHEPTQPRSRRWYSRSGGCLPP